MLFEPEDTVVITEVQKHSGKPVVNVPAGGEDFTLVYKVLRDTSIPVYSLPEKAAKTLKALLMHQKILREA